MNDEYIEITDEERDDDDDGDVAEIGSSISSV